MSQPPLFPIRTGLKRARWPWIAMLSLPWAAVLYFEQISNNAITFKLREFVETPVLITLIASFNLLFNIFVGATCNYASDRVWTPVGRRKPFLIVGWLSVAAGCFILPEVSTLWVLVVTLFFYEMLRDAAAPYESLCNEIVPPHQRGRATAMNNFVRQAAMAVFFAVMIGRWDSSFQLPGGIVVSGQRMIFWLGAAMALGSLAFALFGIREEPPAPPRAPRQRITAASAIRSSVDFFRNVFGERQWMAIYSIALAQMIFWIGFGSLTPLLYTEQWAYSKQTYGNVIAFSTPFTLFVFLPLGGWLADKIDRLKMFKWLACIMTLNHLAFYLFLQLVAENGVPAIPAILAFGMVGYGVGTVGTVCTVSMMFDYVPRDRLGTVLSGIGITRGIASILINNGIGLWVTLFPRHVHPDGSLGYDYSSGYLYLVLCGLVATAVAFWFTRRVESGQLPKLGVIEAERRNREAEEPSP